jgi:glyoxylase-like metal-dependent hydrolase (beta-lactamase superfamily II)
MSTSPLATERLAVGPLATNTYVLRWRPTRRALVIDPGDEPDRILEVVGDDRVEGILLTHCHWDHVQAVDALRAATGAPVAAHRDELAVWDHECTHLHRHGHWDWAQAEHQRPPGPPPVPGWDGTIDINLASRRTWRFGRLAIGIRHTPGHSPGSVSLTMPGQVLTGDTLFPGGPGLTGWPLSDFPTIIASIRRKLAGLPVNTVVLPGHGSPTTIGAEVPHLAAWEARGW